MTEPHVYERTISDLEARVTALGGEIGIRDAAIQELQQNHQAELDKLDGEAARQADEHKALVNSALDEIEQLKARLADKDVALEAHSVELARLAEKTFTSSTPEDEYEIEDYKRENARFIAFVQEVADSRTKFAKEAAALLGQK